LKEFQNKGVGEMIEITLEKYNKIHKDFRGEYLGKRSAMQNSILSKAGLPLVNNGTALLIEDVHFQIIGGK
jgi:hypothetical protein